MGSCTPKQFFMIFSDVSICKSFTSLGICTTSEHTCDSFMKDQDSVIKHFNLNYDIFF